MMMDDLSSLVIYMIYYDFRTKGCINCVNFYAKDVIALCSRCYGTQYAIKFYSIILF